MDLKTNMENITEMFMKKKFWTVLGTLIVGLGLAVNLTGCTSGGDVEEVSDSIPEQNIEIPADDSAASANVNVPVDVDTDKMVAISVENLGRANPFMPPGEKPWVSPSAQMAVEGVPQQRLQYDVLPPIETPNLSVDKGAKKAASTRVSGIMYDTANPSAILNIEGLDYLVRSGDVLNGYKVLSINKSVVTVQVGSNIYKAGVGQLIEDGHNLVNYNTVANLNSKFGGNTSGK